MITQSDIDKFKSLGKATTKAVGEAYQATQLSLDYHAQYVKAFSLIGQADKALDAWYEFCSSFGKAAQGNNYWFTQAYTALAKITPAQTSLNDSRKLLTADMAAHTVLSFPPSADAAAAAKEADKQAAKSGRTVPKGTGSRGIDSLDPTADEPVIVEEDAGIGTPAKVGIAAAAGLALLWIVRKVA